MDGILTGTAVADIELPIGMDMTGYIARTSGSKGIHDELKVRCIVFDNGTERFALIVCDLLGLDDGFVRKTAALIERNFSIPADKIVIACTHTHSGPACIFLQDCGEKSEKVLNSLERTIAACLAQALGRLKPSALTYRTGMCGIGKNRVVRENEESGRLRDIQVGVLTIGDADTGKVNTILVNYACHPVVLDHTNCLYSKDYPHYMEEALKENFGRDVNIIFANGCCGDINPVERGSFEVMRKVGRQLSECIVDIIYKTKTMADISFCEGQISMETIGITIPFEYELNEKILIELKTVYRKKAAEKTAKHMGGDEAKPWLAFMKWADNMLAKVKTKTLPDGINVELKRIRIGPLAILTLPFEVFHDIGLRIKEYFGKDNTMVIGYANGVFGYLPSRSLYSSAAYETGDAYKYFGYPGPVSKDAEEIIFSALTHFPRSCSIYCQDLYTVKFLTRYNPFGDSSGGNSGTVKIMP